MAALPEERRKSLSDSSICHGCFPSDFADTHMALQLKQINFSLEGMADAEAGELCGALAVSDGPHVLPPSPCFCVAASSWCRLCGCSSIITQAAWRQSAGYLNQIGFLDRNEDKAPSEERLLQSASQSQCRRPPLHKDVRSHLYTTC